MKRLLIRLARPVTRRIDSRVEAKTKGLRSENVRLREQVRSLETKVAAIQAQLNGQAAAVDSVGLFFGEIARHNSRVLSADQFESVVRGVEELTGRTDARAAVGQAYRTVVDLETRGLGRIAGTVENVVGKLSVTPLLAERANEVLEIGTLFGLFAAGMVRQLARGGAGTPRLTIVDPLASLQIQAGSGLPPDPSGSPVNEFVLRENLRLADVPEEGVRVFEGYSDDEAVRAKVADRRYDVVVIDGDHSYEGVLKDLQWVEDITSDGGVVVLDDFGDPGWPGVERAVREHLARESRFDLIGIVASSAFLRAVR